MDERELMAIFDEEALELVEQLAQQLGELNEDPKPAVIDAAMRFAHSLKGAAAVVGLEAIAEQAHAIEDALSALLAGQRASPELLDSLRQAGEQLALMVNARARGEVASRDVSRGLGSQDKLEQSRAKPPAFGVRENGLPLQRTDEDVGIADAVRVREMRTDPARVDRVMNELAQLFTVRMHIGHAQKQLIEVLRSVLGAPASGGHQNNAEPYFESLGEDFSKAALNTLIHESRRHLLEFDRLGQSLKHALRALRLVPLRVEEYRWRQIVREAAQESRKRVEFHVQLGDIEIDKTLIEQLREALMHLLRNAVSHGIERPELRRAMSKAEMGVVRLSARAVGSWVELELEDDGCGIDVEAVRVRLLELGSLDRAKLQSMTEDELLERIFEPGFSTAESLTRLSGRGVGLDVVRTQVEHVGGQVWAKARGELGGACFCLRLPSTVVSMTGLFVKQGERRFVLPADAVEGVLSLRPAQLHRLDGGLVLDRAGEAPIRLLFLAELLSARSSGWVPQRLRDSDEMVVLLRRGRSRLGLVVDEVVELRDFVRNRLPWNLEGLASVGGSTVEADGTVSALLELPHLFEQLRHANQDGLERAQVERSRILVVDDVASIRARHRLLLEPLEAEIDLAVDGQDAWDKLIRGKYDMLISDINMPRMDGVELTRRIRSHVTLRELPVILVTSRHRPEELALGISAGADEYLVKGSFEQDRLLELVKRHL
ncbi:MAG: response regulator [Myxococcota bacterium]|nr:response regulator [Myxococcota bacterium]